MIGRCDRCGGRLWITTNEHNEVERGCVACGNRIEPPFSEEQRQVIAREGAHSNRSSYGN